MGGFYDAAVLIGIGRWWANRTHRFAVAASITVVALICVVGQPAGVATAHAELVDVTPAPGSVIADSPDEVVITFTEAVSISGGSIELFDDSGASVTITSTAVDAAVVVALPDDLGDGTYLVAWRVISTDSHPVTGSSTFSIGSETTAPSLNVSDRLPTGVALWRVLAMAATYGGVLVAIGATWFARHWQRRANGEHDLPGVYLDTLDRVVGVASAVGVGGLLVALPARIVTVGGGWASLSDTSLLTDIAGGPIGQATAVSTVGVVGVVLWHRYRSPTGSSAWSGTLPGVVLSVLAIGGFALEGHTRTKDPTWLMVLGDVVHLAAGSVWLGGIVALGFVLPRARGATRARVALDVSSAALWAVGAVSAAGIAMSVMVLPSFNALADTGYGLALLAKVAIVVVLLAIGERNRIGLVPRLEASMADDDPAAADDAVRALRRSLVVESAVFALLLVATATLIGRSPVIAGQDAATGGIESADAIAPIIDPVPLPLSSGVGSIVAAITPGDTGPNVVSLTLVDLDGAPLAVVEPPTIELRELVRVIGPLDFVMQDLGGGRWEAPVDIPFAGAWELTVQVRTGTFDAGDARTEFVVPS